MPSYVENENIMLSGQTAYFKKTGSMVNLGTIEIANTLIAHEYENGYIGPNSVIYGTDLADTPEYIECENEMKTYLGSHWVESSEERSIIANSQVIKTLLEPASTKIQTLADAIN